MPSTLDEFLVHPRYLAGAGEIGRVLQPVVHVHGWPYENNPYGNRIAATSPCGRIEVLCQMAVFHLWKISVRDRPGDERPRWQATFTKETPAEIVGALVQALAADRHVAPEEIVAEWPGHPSTAWRPLLKAGWTPAELTGWTWIGELDGTEDTVTPALDNVHLTSPDGKASLVHTPKPDHLFGEGVGPWQIDVTFGPAWQDQWTAILSAATPVRYLNMLTSAVADPAPVVRAHAQISTATRTAATIRTLPPSRSTTQFHAFEAEMATLDPRHPNQGHPRR